jgi:DNA mismatch repair protein MutL
LHLGEVNRSFTPSYDFVYRGQIFGLFLIAEKKDRLYLVDQHAAHEKILYEKFAADTRPQGLLIPLDFETEPDEDIVVEENLPDLENLGIRVEKKEAGRWSVTMVPESCHGAENAVAEVAGSRYEAAGDLKKELFAAMACRKAVKDGDSLDPATACEIIRKAFLLEVPRCPHGRPIWFEIGREDLFREVGRIV